MGRSPRDAVERDGAKDMTCGDVLRMARDAAREAAREAEGEEREILAGDWVK